MMKYTMTIELEAEEPIGRDYLDCIEEDSLVAVQGALKNITYRDIRPVLCKIEDREEKKAMIKHEYSVDGQTSTGEWFTGTCVSDDIIEAIRLFIKEGYSVHSIERGEQVNADAGIQILSTKIIEEIKI